MTIDQIFIFRGLKLTLKTCLCALILTFSCNAASAQEITRQIPVDGDFQPANIGFRGPVAGGYEGLIALKDNNGILELCGVGATTNAKTASHMRKVLRKGSLEVNGKTVLKNFVYFAKARSARSIRKTRANCRATSFRLNRKIESVSVNMGGGTFRD